MVDRLLSPAYKVWKFQFIHFHKKKAPPIVNMTRTIK